MKMNLFLAINLLIYVNQVISGCVPSRQANLESKIKDIRSLHSKGNIERAILVSSKPYKTLRDIELSRLEHSISSFNKTGRLQDLTIGYDHVLRVFIRV